MPPTPGVAAPRRRRLPAALVDLVVLSAVALSAFLIASWIELSERFAGWASGYERWQVDELPVGLFVLCAGLAWFAWRRWREAQRLRARQQALARHLLNVQERERRHLARELHDELGQHCAAIRVEAACLTRLVDNGLADPAQLKDGAARMTASAESLHRGVRQLLRQLRPPALDALGLPAAIEDLCLDWQRRLPAELRWSIDATLVDVSEPVAIATFRIAQEALSNAARHAAAGHVWVGLEGAGPGRLRLCVADDGRGFAADGAEPGFGLTGIAERVAELDGVLALAGRPGEGVRLQVELPLGGGARR